MALLNRSDTMHSIVTTVYAQHQKIFIPQTVLAEVAYLVVSVLGDDAACDTR